MRNLSSLLMLCLLSLSAALEAESLSLPREAAVPGGIAIVELGDAESMPQAYYGNKQVMVKRHNEQWVALVGLPLSAKPGKQSLQLGNPKKPSGKRNFTVSDKQYEEQHITLKNKRMVNPYANDL